MKLSWLPIRNDGPAGSSVINQIEEGNSTKRAENAPNLQRGTSSPSILVNRIAHYKNVQTAQ